MLLSWGKPKIFVKDKEQAGAIWRLLPTPVEDSTQLETTEGDTVEAKIEGGAVEDVMDKIDTYALKFEERLVKGRKKCFGDKEGVVKHNYEVFLQPEDETAYGIHINTARVSVSDSYTSADGLKQAISLKALANEETTQIEIGVVTVTGTKGSYSPSIVPIEAESETSDSDSDGSIPTA